jgi:hypothetical protein
VTGARKIRDRTGPNVVSAGISENQIACTALLSKASVWQRRAQ